MQTQITCPHCGATNVAGKVFCMSCGNALMSSPAPAQGSGVSTVYLPTQQPPPYSSPSAQTQRVDNQGEQPSWQQPTQAYPVPQQPPPQYGQQPIQATQYTQPVPPYQENPQYPPTQRYPQTGQMPPPQQYNPYAEPPPNAYPPQQQYGQYVQPNQYGQQGQYGQYGPPNQYVNVQVTGQYPQGYGAQPAPVIRRRSTPLFWGLWVFATALAWAVAVPAGFALWDAVRVPLLNNVLGTLLNNSNNASLKLIASLAPLFLIMGAVVGILSGITQALVLGWRGLRAASWVSTTVIGWMLGALAGWIVTVLLNSNGDQILTGSSAGLLSDSPLSSGIVMGAIFGATAGAVLGIAQFLTLQRHSRRAGLWILASPICWAIAAAALVVLLNTIMQTSFGVQLNPYVSEALYGVGAGVVAGAATGAVLPAIV